MGTKFEKVTEDPAGSDYEIRKVNQGAYSGNNSNEIYDKTQAGIKIVEEQMKNGIEQKDILPVYTDGTFLNSINKIIRSLISPKDEEIRKRWFKDDSGKETNYEIMNFYFYRYILTMFYLIYSIFRLFEYCYNRCKIKILSMAYKSNDDPSIINADINKLPKIPQNLSVILNYKSEHEEGGGIEGLCDDGSSVTAWCLSSGIPNLSIYEINGILKKNIPEFSKSIFEKFELYFGTENIPNFLIKIPHLNLSYSGIDGILIDDSKNDSSNNSKNNNNNNNNNNYEYDIEISLLSKVDGRSSIVELTKVMAQLSKNGELKKSDITIDFLDHELKQLVGDEPDLIILFQPYLDLQGYPPWHIRLSEMYWEPDNENVSYAIYLRALQKYSTCKVNIGR